MRSTRKLENGALASQFSEHLLDIGDSQIFGGVKSIFTDLRKNYAVVVVVNNY